MVKSWHQCTHGLEIVPNVRCASVQWRKGTAGVLGWHLALPQGPELGCWCTWSSVEAGVGLGVGTEGLRQLTLVGMNTYGPKPVKSAAGCFPEAEAAGVLAEQITGNSGHFFFGIDPGDALLPCS